MVASGIFAGRTAIITGGSRGIGKEIALKLAKNGANIVIAAKTTEPHPKLPGTIYTAVEDVEKVGGKGLACMMDVRDEKSIEATVQKALQKFGSIDILVNNASAITLTGTVETEMKKFDLMNQINSRGTFMMSQKCIPHLKKGKNPHILNISPPLVMEQKWFANHVAYTMAKYGMSMCVLGMSQELKSFGIGVNALWPRTTIWTEALRMLYGDPVASKCRKPIIMADAAHLILSRNSRNYTGNFAIDEEILAESGVTDFEQYAVAPGKPLMPDFFLPAKYFTNPKESNDAAKKQKAQQFVDITQDINQIRKLINKDLVKKVDAIYRFNLKNGDKVQKVYIDLKNGDGDVYQSADDKEADATLTTAVAEFREIFTGKLSPELAFASGKLKIDGKMGKVMLLSKVLG